MRSQVYNKKEARELPFIFAALSVCGIMNTMAEQQTMSPEEEIKKLEQQLEQKKRELAKTETTPQEEKEMLREVLKEHIETLRPAAPSAAPTPPPVMPAPMPPAPADTQAHIKQGEQDQATVRLLVEKAMTGTIEDAVREAEKISPYMVDELHDHLVDDMYDKLVSLRKIKKL